MLHTSPFSKQNIMFDLKNHVHQHIDPKKEDDEFDFWISNQAIDYENSSRNIASHNLEDYFNNYSSPLLRKRCAPSIESSPLLPRNYHNNDQISPRICSQAIAEGRKELMEMIGNMPESSYELSLKDLVDEKQEVKQEVVSDQEASFRFYSNNDESKKPTTKKSKSFHKPVQMSRSGSMEKETFLIKMFIPSFNRKTKVKPEKQSRLCSSLWFDGSDNHTQEGWSLKRLLLSGKGKDSRSSSNSSSSSRGSSKITSRLCRHNKSTGCWSFICMNKSKQREYMY